MESTKRAKVIAITGQAGSGKDTMFALLKGMLPKLDVIRVAFGDEVKREYAEHLDVDLDEMLHIEVDWLVPNKGTLSELANGVRFILQENGLEYEQ